MTTNLFDIVKYLAPAQLGKQPPDPPPPKKNPDLIFNPNFAHFHDLV